MSVVTYVLELLAFAIVLYVLWRYLAPMMRKGMTAQQERIRTQLAESRLAKERLEKAEQDAERALENARAEAAEIREQARVDAERIVAELSTRAQAEADRIIAAAGQQLAAERESLVRQLRADVGRLAVDLAARVAAESLLEESLRNATIGRFCAEIAELGAAGRNGEHGDEHGDARTAVPAGEGR